LLEQIVAVAGAVVTITVAAYDRLLLGYAVDAAKVSVIPHGAGVLTGEAARRHDRPHLLTWGLLGPGKGIEWAIDAVADLGDIDPHPRYLIAGATHPKVAAHAGQAYRSMLMDRARLSGASSAISFDDTYRDLAALTELIHSADVVVLPYDSVDQVTSGVLVDAVAAGRPVISTAFPHAVELLSGGAGVVVPQRDAVALAGAVRDLVEHPERLEAMAAECRRLAPELSWPAVAGRYDELASSLLLTARTA
jgi:glycosyltransferase involved in cell wall biosynthesis